MGLLTPHELQKLLNSESITAKHPWDTNREEVVDAFYNDVCNEITQATGASSKIEWDHYGQGYASYIDARFYKPILGEASAGLIVLLSRLSSYYVFLEYWHQNGRGKYLPMLECVDEIPSPAASALAKAIQPILERHGLQRLSREALSAPLPAVTKVATLLSDPPFTEFDALFHWED